MVFINEKQFQAHAWQFFKEGMLSRLGEKKTLNYEVMKRAPSFKKGHFRASKWEKNSCVSPLKCVFLNFSAQINYLSFFERGGVFQCWMHQVLRLRPAYLILVNSLIQLIRLRISFVDKSMFWRGLLNILKIYNFIFFIELSPFMWILLSKKGTWN